MFTRSAALLDACVLNALKQGDTYGYELTARIGDMPDVSESTLYPVLKRLERSGLLSTYDEAVNGRNRRYYSLTAEGDRSLSRYKDEWESFKTMIDGALYGRKGGTNEQN